MIFLGLIAGEAFRAWQKRNEDLRMLLCSKQHKLVSLPTLPRCHSARYIAYDAAHTDAVPACFPRECRSGDRRHFYEFDDDDYAFEQADLSVEQDEPLEVTDCTSQHNTQQLLCFEPS